MNVCMHRQVHHNPGIEAFTLRLIFYRNEQLIERRRGIQEGKIHSHTAPFLLHQSLLFKVTPMHRTKIFLFTFSLDVPLTVIKWPP